MPSILNGVHILKEYILHIWDLTSIQHSSHCHISLSQDLSTGDDPGNRGNILHLTC